MTRGRSFTLYLSGGWHLTGTGGRIASLPVDAEAIDVVFRENVMADPPSRATTIANWIVTPLLCLSLTLYLGALAGAARLGLTDEGVVATLEEAGADVVNADRNFHRILASERRHWG